MQLLLDQSLILLIVVIAINSSLAFVVYKNNRQNAPNLLFVLLSIFSSFWLIANYISINPVFLESSLFWIRLTIFFAVPQATLFFLLAHTFPNNKIQLPRTVFLILFALTILVMIINLSPYAFRDVVIDGNSPRAVPAPGILPFMIFGISMIGGALVLLIKKLKRANGIERQQLRFILIGISGMMGAIIFTVLLPVVLLGNNDFVPYSPIYTTFFLGMTTYAIFKHNLFNVRVIATELFSALIALVFLVRVLSSNTVNEFLFNLVLFIILSIFGILLVRGTIREIRELQRLSRAKSEFVSIVSHQMRTPLTAIKGFISMVQEGSGTKEEQNDWLDKAYLTNERLIRLVNDILNIARIEEGRIQYDFKDNVDICALVESVVSEVKVTAEKRGLPLLWKKPEETIPPIRADELKLRQVILNLIDNAVHYTEKGWVSARLLYFPELQKIRIIVQDTGIGITQEDLQNLFDKFSRGEAGKKTNAEGMGIGLYLARAIVQAHNGKIWVESEGLHKGSKFNVELPVR